MGVVDNRRVVERFAEAVRANDMGALGELMHPDIVVRYPQSGEAIRGRDNYLAMLSNYPSGLPDAEFAEPRGTPETVHVASSFGMPIITVTGSGDTFFLEGIVEYADGGVFNWVSIVTVREGKLAEEVSYWAAPFDPPQWRRPFVEA